MAATAARLRAQERLILEQIESQCKGHFEPSSQSAPSLDLNVWGPVRDSLTIALCGGMSVDQFWAKVPLSQSSQKDGTRVRRIMEATVSASQQARQATSGFSGQDMRQEASLDNLSAHTAFIATQERTTEGGHGDDLPAPVPVWTDNQVQQQGDQLRMIRSRREARDQALLEEAAWTDSDEDDLGPHRPALSAANRSPDNGISPSVDRTPPSAQPRPISPSVDRTPPSAQPPRHSAQPRPISPSVARTPPSAQPRPNPPSAQLPRPLPSSQPRPQPDSTSVQSQLKEDEWPLKTELRGTEAHFYRGPLPPHQVLALLDSTISDNGRQSLTGVRAGYLVYFHFMGRCVVPAKRRRSGAGDEDPAARQEGWKCRSCHTIVHAPMNQVSNLGGHLYGKTNKDKPPRIGCLDARRDGYAEAIPTPERDLNGALIRHRAGKLKQSL
ncbi:hypothetical protein CF326_g7723 [Tilletia indica]|nr:hypothetical protein CF326_g7723 [Tilletia indica]